jgi:hypothetical protein
MQTARGLHVARSVQHVGQRMWIFAGYVAEGDLGEARGEVFG